MSVHNYNASKQSIQAPNNSRCVVLRIELREITQDSDLAILLNQLIYEGRHNLSSWIRFAAEELCETTLLTRTPQTMRRYLRRLVDMGFLQVRENPLDKFDRAHEYRLNIVAIEKAVTAAGYSTDFLPDSSNNHNVPSNKEKKNLKPFRSLSSVIKKNDNTTRARKSSIQDPDEQKIKTYQQLMHGQTTVDQLDPDTDDAVQRFTKRVSKALFKRDPETPGEIALVQSVVDGDLPLSAAVPLSKHVNLQEITHRSVLYAAIEKFKQLPAWKLKTIIHPIRYIAEIVHQEISDFVLDRYAQYA